jgi:hypothetical protein
MRTSLLFLVLFVLVADRAAAQPKSGDVQPNRLDLGQVYVGATVEASFMVFEKGNDAEIPFTVVAPDFVKVLATSTRAREYGKENEFVTGTAELAVDTSAEGDFNGVVQISLGQTPARVRVTCTVKPRRPGLIRLLVAETPFDCYSTDDSAMFDTWRDLVRDASLDVDYLLVRQPEAVIRDIDLRPFDCILLAAGGLTSLRPPDIKRVRRYAEEGGRVVVAANHFFQGTIKRANWVLAGYGLELRDEEGQPDEVVIGEENIAPELVQGGISNLRAYRASPLAVNDADATHVLVKAVGVGQPNDAFVAMADAGGGQVAAIGESLWWYWISEKRWKNTDNAALLRRLLAPP